MADFLAKKTHETSAPTIEVTVDPNKPLPVGRHKFELKVVDSGDNMSAPDTVEVIIVDTQKPTAVLEVRPNSPQVGESFTLIGERSTDIPPGKIVKFIWTLLE